MFDKIFHPTDFTETSHVAFLHALKIALSCRAELKMLHVTSPTSHGHSDQFPRVRETLEAWRILKEGSHRSDVVRTGIDVEKTVICDSNFIATVTEFLKDNPSALTVLATHRHAHTLFGSSKSEPIARTAATTTLFIPDESLGFVASESGTVSLRSIVVPVALNPCARATIDSIQQLLNALAVPSAEVHLLHVGDASTQPAISNASTNKIRSHTYLRQGEIVPTIIDFALEMKADLVAMTTDGHHGFLDALRGNTTEQVLRRLSCPLWAVTAH
jgi:nucleotide-binding universal stress UspA family protein